MEHNDRRNLYDILELPAEATPAQVRKAYLFLKDLYSSESIITVPLENEIPAEKRHRIIREIEEAYRALAEEPRNSPAPLRDQRQVNVEFTSYSGQVLKQIRQQLDVELHEMSLATNIQAQYLEDIENENFASLPVYVYTRGYVVNYAKYLRLDHQKVSTDYMSRYLAWRQGT